jgi:hypothetical protein
MAPGRLLDTCADSLVRNVKPLQQGNAEGNSLDKPSSVFINIAGARERNFMQLLLHTYRPHQSCTLRGPVRVLIAFAGILLATAIPLRGQFVVGPPPWNCPTIQSTGGITYFTYSATHLNACDWIEIGPVIRVGTNLFLTAMEMRGVICVECIDCFHNETNATVLGSLDPGHYRLSISAPEPFGGALRLIMIMDFEVPADSGPTLSLSCENGQVQVDGRGVPAATYTLEGSTTLTNWTTVTTVTGAPFTFTNDATGSGFRFYRTRVTSGKVWAN